MISLGKGQVLILAVFFFFCNQGNLEINESKTDHWLLSVFADFKNNCQESKKLHK